MIRSEESIQNLLKIRLWIIKLWVTLTVSHPDSVLPLLWRLPDSVYFWRLWWTRQTLSSSEYILSDSNSTVCLLMNHMLSQIQGQRNEIDNPICRNDFQMSFQTTLIISNNIPTSWFEIFSRTLNVLNLSSVTQFLHYINKLKIWRTQQDSTVYTKSLTLYNSKAHKYLSILLLSWWRVP